MVLKKRLNTLKQLILDEASLRHTKHYFSLRLPDYYCLINADTNKKVDEENLSNTTKRNTRSAYYYQL